jgi:pilus assembly protein CpaF
MGLASLAQLSPQAATLHATAAFDAVVHLERERGQRSVVACGALVLRDGALDVEPVVTVDGEGKIHRGAGYRVLMTRIGLEP